MTPSKRLGNPVGALNDTMLFSFLRRNPLKGPLSPPSSARAQSPGLSSATGDTAMPDLVVQAQVEDAKVLLKKIRDMLSQNEDKLAGVGVDFSERLKKLSQQRPVSGKLVKRSRKATAFTFLFDAQTLYNDVEKSLQNLKIVEAKLTGEPKSSSVRSKGRTRRRSMSPKPVPPALPPPKSPTPSEPIRQVYFQQPHSVDLTRSATEKLPSRLREHRAAQVTSSYSGRTPKHEASSPVSPVLPPSFATERYRHKDDGRRAEPKATYVERRRSYERLDNYKERDRERDKGRDRDRDRNKDRDRDRDRERDRDKDRGRRERDKERDINRDRDRDRDKERDINRDRDRDRDKERDRDKDRDRDRDRDKDRDRERYRDREKDREREKDRDRHHKDYYKDRDRDYTREKDKYKDNGKDKEQDHTTGNTSRPSTSRHQSEGGDYSKDRDDRHRRHRYERSRSSPDRRRERPESPDKDFVPRYVYADIPLDEVKLIPGVPKAPPTLVAYPGEDEETRRSRYYDRSRDRRHRARTTSPAGREAPKKDDLGPPPASAPPIQDRYQKRHQRSESHRQYPQSQSQIHLPQQQQADWFPRLGKGPSSGTTGTLHPPPLPHNPPPMPHYMAQPVPPSAPQPATRFHEMFSPYNPTTFQPLPKP